MTIGRAAGVRTTSVGRREGKVEEEERDAAQEHLRAPDSAPPSGHVAVAKGLEESFALVHQSTSCTYPPALAIIVSLLRRPV